MATTLTDLQTDVSLLDRRFDLVLTAGTGLKLANIVYRKLGAANNWEELRRADSSLSTTTSTESYTFPTTYTFYNILSIIIQDWDNDLEYKTIAPCIEELYWNQLSSRDPAFPEVYIKEEASAVMKLLLRPVPNYTGSTIKITGIIEPTAFVDGNSTTVFIKKSVDDVLAYLIASALQMKKDDEKYATFLFSEARTLLKNTTGVDITPQQFGLGIKDA